MRREWALAILLAGAGLTHFAVPQFYDEIVPRVLPGPSRWWTIGSGVAEVMSAIALAARPTRRAGAVATLLLFVAVFPANVQMALDWYDDGTLRRAASLLRLPLQIPLIVLAWTVVRYDSASSTPGGSITWRSMRAPDSPSPRTVTRS